MLKKHTRKICNHPLNYLLIILVTPLFFLEKKNLWLPAFFMTPIWKKMIVPLTCYFSTHVHHEQYLCHITMIRKKENISIPYTIKEVLKKNKQTNKQTSKQTNKQKNLFGFTSPKRQTP